MFNKNFSDKIFSLHRNSKRGIAIATDTFLCVFTLWLAFYLRLEELVLFKDIGLTSILLTIFLAIPIFWVSGLYRTLFRYSGISILSTISLSVLFYGLIFFSIISLYGITGVPRSIGVIQPILLFVFLITQRFFLKYLLTGSFNKSGKDKENVLIYGAGAAGRQLFTSLEGNLKYNFLNNEIRLCIIHLPKILVKLKKLLIKLELTQYLQIKSISLILKKKLPKEQKYREIYL